jgi:hypothetical protein
MGQFGTVKNQQADLIDMLENHVGTIGAELLYLITKVPKQEPKDLYVETALETMFGSHDWSRSFQVQQTIIYDEVLPVELLIIIHKWLRRKCVKIENICSMIDSSIQEKIFVATDDKSYLGALIERYGNRIVYDSSVSISNNKEPLHLTTCDRPKINEEVLSNVYLLSCCGSFLYSFSNVSLLTLIMGVYNFETFYHLN